MTSILPETITTPDHFSIEQDRPVLSVLDNLCCYKVTGEDATDFLQGQFSNDIKQVDADHAQLTAYCTPKGRMLATFFIGKHTDGYLLVTSSDIADEVMKRLQMFVMRSKVSITKLETNVVLGLSSDKQAMVLDHLDLAKPDNDYQSTNNNDLVCIKIPGIDPRYLLIGNSELLEKVQLINNEQMYFYTHEYWQWLDIHAGVPMITASTQEAFVPQMANMELIDGVSFSKGCYPGQEVVARLHYLGNANRRMFRIKSEAKHALKPGDDIYSPKSNQAIGKFLSAIKVGNNKYDGLAVLRIEASKETHLITSLENGDEIKILNLPYEVPTELKEKNK